MSRNPPVNPGDGDQWKKWAEDVLAFKASNEPRPWDKQAYNKQRPPDDPRHWLPDPVTGARCGCDGPSDTWEKWLYLSGRGTGKTLSGSNWILGVALGTPKIWVAVCAPTYQGVKDVCFMGKSGIINIAQPGEIADFNRNDLRITLRNGSIIQGYTADRPDQIRGANLYAAWIDEYASIRYPSFVKDGLMPALRECANPRLMITTTPKSVRLLQDLLEEAQERPDIVHVTHARTDENYKAQGVLKMFENVKRQVGLTSLTGRQELLGEMVSNLPGAMFQQEWFDDHRIRPENAPIEFRQVIVAVDPASSVSDRADETGIVVVAEGVNHEYYCLEDCTIAGTTQKVMTAIAVAYYKWDAGMIVVEKNVAGDWFKQALYSHDPHLPYRAVMAMKTKSARAQPVSVQAERGLVHMIGTEMAELEKQLCLMTAFDDRSQKHDDRADAFVWGMRELMGAGAANWEEVYGFDKCGSCGAKINIFHDEGKCRACGTEIIRQEKVKTDQRFTRWSNAYVATCPEEGHGDYPARLKECPRCHGNPGEYLAAMLKYANMGGSIYTGRDLLRSREF